MRIKELFLDELEREAEGSKQALQRVPEGKNDWKPHEKSIAARLSRAPRRNDAVMDRDDDQSG